MDVMAAEVRRMLRDEGRLTSFQSGRSAASPFYSRRSCSVHAPAAGWRFRLFIAGGAALPRKCSGELGLSGRAGIRATETAPVI
jgi:hypothetical protein